METKSDDLIRQCTNNLYRIRDINSELMHYESKLLKGKPHYWGEGKLIYETVYYPLSANDIEELQLKYSALKGARKYLIKRTIAILKQLSEQESFDMLQDLAKRKEYDLH